MATATPLQQSRALHWAIRSSELPQTLDFLRDVLGMHVLRHEEMDKPCQITCNGNYPTAWSKTMVGYGPEDQHFGLEVSYNYGVHSYKPGNGLCHFGLGMDDPKAALEAAASRGCPVDGDIVTGPDGYRFRLLQQPQGRRERFIYVALRVHDLSKASEYYGSLLGMQDMSSSVQQLAPKGLEHMKAMGYSPDQVVYILFEDPANKDLQIEQWEGRNAVAVPHEAIHDTYKKLEQTCGKQGIKHEMTESEMDAGKMAIGVAFAPDGYELCLVSRETIEKAGAADYKPNQDIDWAGREKAERERTAA